MKKILLALSSVALLMTVIVLENRYNTIEQINQDLSNAPSAAGGTNYYVCDTGDDANDGLSESTPFFSFDKAINTFNKISAGDSVLFCRGGVFPTSTHHKIFNQQCNASSMCTLGDYGDLNKERPHIVANGVTALRFEDGGNADPDGGYKIKNLVLQSSTDSHVGVWMFNDVDDVLLDNLHIEGFAWGVQSAGSNAVNPGANRLQDRITLKNSVIIGNSEQGWLGAGNDILIENNYFENNGFGQRILNHNIYIASNREATNVTVRGNTLYKSAMVNGLCEGVSLVVHGIISDLTIEDNIIKEDVGKITDNCWGIGVDPGSSPVIEKFTNVIIRNNQLLNVGNVAIGCSSCNGAEIEGNTIIDQGNMLKAGISIPAKSEAVDFKSIDVAVFDNSIILSKDVGVGVVIAGENQFAVRNNKISQPMTATNDCIKQSLANAATDTSNNTCTKHSEITLIKSSTSDGTDIAGTTAKTDTIAKTDTTAKPDTETKTTINKGVRSQERKAKRQEVRSQERKAKRQEVRSQERKAKRQALRQERKAARSARRALKAAVTYRQYSQSRYNKESLFLDNCRARTKDKCLLR